MHCTPPQNKPVGRKFCCSQCASALQFDYTLDSHTKACFDRQEEYRRVMVKRMLMPMEGEDDDDNVDNEPNV